MIGSGYWATGISLTYHPGNTGGPASDPEPREWSARVEYLDDGFCEWRSTEGEIRTRYAVPTMSDAVDLIKADAERMGIVWKNRNLYYCGDGEDEEFPPPEGWREAFAVEAERIGWVSPYEIAPLAGSEAPGAPPALPIPGGTNPTGTDQ